MNEPLITQYADTLYSCLIPYDMHFEHRMPAHSIIFVRSGKLLIKENQREVEVATILSKSVPLDGLFQSLMVYVDNETEPTADMLSLKLREAIMCLLSLNPGFYPTLFDFNESWKIDILEFMENNFTEDMTLDEFASYTGRSLASFKRDFAKISTLPPLRWIMEHRLDKAKRMLENGMGLAQDVGYSVGFKNRSHFSQAFKKRYGYAPNDYVKLNMSKIATL